MPSENAAMKPWDTLGINGVHGFLRKLTRLYRDADGNALITDGDPSAEAERALHKAIKKVTEDLDRLSWNTVVSALMIGVNELTEAYFKLHPRQYDEPWPSSRHRTTDLQLRALLEQLNASKGSSVKDFQRMAKEKLGIEFSDDQTKFRMSDLAFWKEVRQGEMADQVGAV